MTLLLRLPLAIFSLAWQSAFLAIGQIWANKLRALLTTLGIVIGVASVTAVIAALTGLKTSVLAEFESFGTNKIFIRPDTPRDPNGRRTLGNAPSFRPELFEGLLENCPSVRTLTRLSSYNANIVSGSKSDEGVTVQGIEPAWHEIEARGVTVGRPFSLVDVRQARAVCLINDKAREKLSLPTDPTSESIIVGDRRFRIIGVVEGREESGLFGGGQSDSEVFVPFTTARAGRDLWMRVIAASRSPEVSDEARAEISFFLRRRRHIPVGDPDNFRVEAVEKIVRQFTELARTMTMVAAGVVGISLLVGGVGIMNIMLVSVSERTREIGLRKAVGARPSAILLQFLIEAMMLCLMGGLIGVVIGQGLTSLLASFPAAKLQNAAIPGWAIALSFGFSAAVGLIFGMFPAIKAARLDPIEALRHE